MKVRAKYQVLNLIHLHGHEGGCVSGRGGDSNRGHIPAGMELFAREMSHQLDASRLDRQSEIYLLIGAADTAHW